MRETQSPDKIGMGRAKNAEKFASERPSRRTFFQFRPIAGPEGPVFFSAPFSPVFPDTLGQRIAQGYALPCCPEIFTGMPSGISLESTDHDEAQTAGMNSFCVVHDEHTFQTVW